MFDDSLERQFKQYLYIDRKLDTSRAAQVQSQLKTFKAFFTSLPFTRKNFNSYIQSLIDRGMKYSSINLYIALGKNYARFIKLAGTLKINQLV